jgi:hypothetical protein
MLIAVVASDRVPAVVGTAVAVVLSRRAMNWQKNVVAVDLVVAFVDDDDAGDLVAVVAGQVDFVVVVAIVLPDSHLLNIP